MTSFPLDQLAPAVDAEIDELIGPPNGEYARLVEAMRYSALGGGKRIRAWLVWASGQLFEVGNRPLLRVGAAIELLHAYSLIHDDLPAMDDAETRRGKPTSHRAFDQATAILAGDALQALAFEAIARDDWQATNEQRLALVRELTNAAGVHGMCGGQMLDLLAEKSSFDLDRTIAMQSLKTGALFGFSCRSGGILGNASKDCIQALDRYAEALGLAFQIQDDLLDLTGDEATLGKDAGQDSDRGKATFPDLLGIDGARQHLAELQKQAKASLSLWGPKADHLADMFDFVISRRS